MLSLAKRCIVQMSALLLVADLACAQIIDLRTGQALSEPTLVGHLRQQDVVLLGELHDNAQHHALRGRLITQLARENLTVVAEHLPADARVKTEGVLLSDLQAAGFDDKGWGWPLHALLFDAVRAASLPLVGGNLPKGFSKRLYSEGEAGLPAPLAQIYRAATLDAKASERLNQDLIDGHCGKLPAKYLQPMQLVQRVTDLSMAQALLDHKPSVLLAGNGHVRKDYGVPQVLRALVPSLKFVSVGFYENDQPLEELVKSFGGRYDIVWLTEPAQRTDPCADFKMK